MKFSPERRRSHETPGLVLLCVALVALLSGRAGAQVLDVDLGTNVYLEPSKTSNLTVINPQVGVTGHIAGAVSINAHYEADIVSGATESIKGGRLATVDIVSSATRFDDVRHVASGGVAITRENTNLAVSYSYGTESDYRSQSFAVSAGTNFFQKNTEIVLSYARGFDKVCTTAFAESDSPSVRTPLDASNGCFTSDDNRAEREVSLDNFQAGWTQAWTPVLATQMVLTGALQHGFLENPYRAVVVAPAGDQALENHPDNRARAAMALRGRLYVRPIQVAFSAGARYYLDTWDIFGQDYEVAAERYLFEGLRVQARASYYTQTAALFYSDDYTGGEPVDGPNGQYWTGDRELSALHNLQYGGRLVYSKRGTQDARFLGIFLGLTATAAFDLINTGLDRFTWGGKDPDDTLGMLLSLGLKSEF